MKQRNKLYIGYVVFFACLFVPMIGSASFTNSNNQIATLKRYSEKNLFATNNVNEKVVNTADAFGNFLPVSKVPPVLNGNMVGQALASNASLLNWNKPTADLEIEKIIVYRTAIADGNGMLPSVGIEVEIAGNSTHYVDGDVKTGVTYEYAIRAVDIEGVESEVSNVVAVTTNEGYDGVHNADRVVGKVTATQATLNIESLFSDESKVLGFYRGLFGDEIVWENNGEYKEYLGEIFVNLKAGFLHHFVVVPLDLNGNILGAGEIITVVAPPHAPGNLQEIEVSHNFVTLQWENTNDLENIPEYGVTEIYRYDSWSDNADDLEFLMSVDERGSAKFTDLGIEFDRQYTYAVKTRVGAGNRSEFSNIVKVITLLPEVSNLQTGDIGVDSIEITWENAFDDPIVVNDKGIVHDIYRDGTLITDGGVSGNDNTFIDDGLDALTSYKYHIVTRSNNSNSNPSGTLEVTTRPHAPNNLRATNITTDSVLLEWDDPNDAKASYLIYEGESRMAEINNRKFLIMDLDIITSYEYRVVIRVGEDNYSMPSIIDVTTRPHAPQNLIATWVTSDFVTLEWENINDLTNVTEKVANVIYRDGVYLDEVPDSDKTFTDSTVAQGTTYTYTVATLIGDDNRSMDSNFVTVNIGWVVVPPVKNLRTTDVWATEVEITWDNTIDESILAKGDVFHKVYRGVTELATVSGTGNSFRDTGLDALADYEYYIVTQIPREGATSAPSDILRVTTLAKLNQPGGLRATEVTSSSVKLEWTNNNSNIANVQQDIYRDDDVLKEDIGNVSEFTDATALPGITYEYKIVVRRGNERLASSTISVTIPIILNQPSGLKATEVTASRVKLEWENPNSNIANVVQDIYRDGIPLRENIGNVSEFTDTTALPEITYKYKVVVRRGSERLESNTIEVTPLAELTAPSGLKATEVTVSSVKLEWMNPNSNIANVKQDIYRDGIPLRENIGNVSEFTDTTASSAITYKYKVVARRGSDEVTSSDITVTIHPRPPSDLKATEITESSVTIKWVNNNGSSKSVQNAIYRKGTLIKIVPGGDSQYEDKGLNIHETYNYEVVAQVGTLEAPSNTITITTLPARPVNLKSTNVTVFSVGLSWGHNLGTIPAEDITYHIYRDNKPIGTSGTASYIDRNADSSKTYSYHVTAVRNSNKVSSLPSDQLNVTTKTKYNLYTVKAESWYRPWEGEKHRSSENMNSLQTRDNYRVTINPMNNPISSRDNIKFDIKQDKMWQVDPTLFFNVKHGSMLNPQFVGSKDNFYIANPSGATSSFEVIIECYDNNPRP